MVQGHLLRLLGAAAVLNCSSLSMALAASSPPEPKQLDVESMPLVRTVDERFQSFQIGMSHLTGGDTWISYDDMPEGESQRDYAGDLAPIREPREPADLTNPRLRILGVPNRLFLAVAGSVFCVFVEVLLNLANALTWDYGWWNVRAPWLIWLLGYLPFFLVSFWVHDMQNTRKQAMTVGAILAFDGLCLLLFGPVLGWI